MPNIQYKNALERLIKNFKNDFLSFSRKQYTSDSKLRHPGEFGASREIISKKFIEGVVPSSKTIKTKGFILNSNNETTSEQDLIIYSTNDTPVLTLENTSFIPVETVVSVGQIKSVIQSKKDLKIILDNLVEVKKVRDNMGHSSVIWRSHDLFNGKDGYYTDNAFDQVFTFVICEKINFTITAEEINELYDEGVKDYLKHNLILDTSNGLYGYQIKKEDPFIAIPYVKDGKTMPVLVGTKDEWHLKQFLTNIHIHTSSNTIFHPEMARYLN